VEFYSGSILLIEESIMGILGLLAMSQYILCVGYKSNIPVQFFCIYFKVVGKVYKAAYFLNSRSNTGTIDIAGSMLDQKQ
jgi:hypothetical protein